MAANMARAWREVAHATVQDDADIEGWRSGEDVTGRVVRALIAACEAERAAYITISWNDDQWAP